MLPVLFHVGPFSLYSFGVFLFLGVVFGLFVAWKKAAEYHIEDDTFLDVALGAVFWGVIGARAAYVITHFDAFGWQFVRWIWLTHYVGLSLWGGLIGGILALWWLSRAYDLNVWQVLDLASLGGSLGIALGRIGSFLNGSSGGIAIRGITVPVQLVEVVGFAILLYWLWRWERSYRTFIWYRGNRNVARPGFLFFTFLIVAGIIWSIVGPLKAENRLWLVKPTQIEGLVAILVGIPGLYSRSGRKLQNDWTSLTKSLRRKK